MKTKASVRQSLFFAAFLFSSLTPLTQGLGCASARADILPDIEAHQFEIIPLEKSKTGRVYRFRTNPNQIPHTGNIVLIQEGKKPIMAFRVLKTVSETGEFIGKRVRRYDTVGELKLNERYESAEKLADLVSPPPPENPPEVIESPPLPPPPQSVAPQEAPPLVAPAPEVLPPEPPPVVAPPSEAPAADVPPAPIAPPPAEAAPPKALDVEAYDDDLDGSTSPQNLKKGADDYGDDSEGLTEARSDFEVDEVSALSPFKNMLGISMGVFRNMANFNLTNPTPHNGFSGYYSHQLDHSVFVHGKRPQDSLSLEYGFIYYTRLNANSHNDDYTIFPLRAELRYDLHLSELFSLLAYAGVQYNLILSTQNVSATSPSDVATSHGFQGFQANVGAGFLYNIGPQWYVRGDLALDRFALGLAVKW
ncbi:MAG: outer membrane beta-barrel protein [Bdellovibrionales bacterium]|nr:outer membrane beta-barrel protein [Oligoflexia bacterium]